MTMEEWISLYEKKTESKFKPNPNFKLLFFPERGFCEVAFAPKTKMVMAYQLCGDGRFWKRVLDSLAIVLGYEHCGAILIRQVKAYIRLFGYRITSKDALTDGNFIYYAKDNDGSQARLAPAWEEPNGTQAYYATWNVKKVDK
jgi:hypothetical protein